MNPGQSIGQSFKIAVLVLVTASISACAPMGKSPQSKSTISLGHHSPVEDSDSCGSAAFYIPDEDSQSSLSSESLFAKEKLVSMNAPEIVTTYIPPQVLSQTKVVAGFMESESKVPADVVDCDSGSVRLYTRYDLKSCDNPVISKSFHEKVLPRIYQCYSIFRPYADMSQPINLIHWGIYNNREERMASRLSQHAYAAAIDIHAIKQGSSTLNFEQAKDDMRITFDKFVKSRMGILNQVISEEEYVWILKEFDLTPEAQNLEWLSFWSGYLDCLSNYNANTNQVQFYTNAGKFPGFIPHPTKKGYYMTRIVYPTSKNKAILHDNHVHIHQAKDQDDLARSTASATVPFYESEKHSAFQTSSL